MVSIKLKFRASSKAGKEGVLYYQVVHNRAVRQIATQYKIFPDEWSSEVKNLIIKPSSHRLNYLESIRRTVRSDMERMYRIVRKWGDDDKVFTIDEIVEAFHHQSPRKTLFTYMERIISHYWQQGQYRTSETYSTTLNSFKRFRADVDVELDDIDSSLVEAYDSYLRHNELSPNTISFYLKHLRAVYNRAVFSR